MTAWFMGVNLISLDLIIGSFACLQSIMYTNEKIENSLCVLILIASVVSSLFIVKKALATKKRSYLLYIIIPVVVLLAVVIFRAYIGDFLYDLLFKKIIGPSSIPPPV